MWRALVVPGLALAMIPLYLATASKIVDHDVFAMAEVAQMVVDGRPLYGATWDNKAPLALLYYAPPQWILRGSYASLQLEMLAVVTLQAALFWWALAVRPLWVRLTSAMMVFLLPLLDFGFVWSSSEDITNLLAVPILLGSYRIATEGRVRGAACLGMGAALVLAFHARQTAVFYGVLPVLAILTSPATPRAKAGGLLMGAAGAVLGAAIVVGLILEVGDWRGYLYTVFEAPRRYQGHYWNGIQGLFAMRGTAILLMLGGATVVLATRGPHRLFFVAVAAVALAVVLVPMKPFSHYWKQIFPALCLMLPEALHRLSPGRTPRAGVIALVGYLGINAALTCAYMGLVRTNFEGHYSRPEADLVAAQIRRVARPGDTLFVVGPVSAYLHFATDLDPVDALYWDFFLEGELIELSGRDVEKVFEAYRSAPPDILVLEKGIEARVRAGQSDLGRREFREMLAYLLGQAGYQPAAESGNYRILNRPGHLRASPQPGTPARAEGTASP